MHSPYENVNRPSWLSVAGHSLSLPCFFPSISSVKTNLLPLEYLRMLVGINHPQFLISAFDIYKASHKQRPLFTSILQTAVEQEQLILFDSGNYERYWHNDDSWDVESFHSVIRTEPSHLAFSFDDNQYEYQDIKLIVDNIETSVIATQDEATMTTIIPIVHGNADILTEVTFSLSQKLYPIMIAAPERELGDGIISRASTVLRIRKNLDQAGIYCPLHLLGTGNPLSILIYSMCGADSFDGLEWCQTTVDHSTSLLYHFHQREFFSEQTPFSSMPEMPYEHATLAHNLLFYRKWMDTIQKSIHGGIIIDLVEHFLGRSFCEKLLGRLQEIT